jgi:hypothetical protein
VQPISGTVVHRVLVLTAIACCALVAASFVLFARDQLAGASKHQQNEVVSSTPVAPHPAPRLPRPEAQPRRFIDGAAQTLTSPFRSIVESDNPWVTRGIPALFAFLVYGVGLGYLARYSNGWS